MSSSQPAQELGLSAKARRTGEQPISFLMAAALGDPKLINFAAGLVDPLTLPVEAMQNPRRSPLKVLERLAGRALV